MAAGGRPLSIHGGPPLSIHPQAELGFGRTAQAYERARPEYPPAAIEWLAERLGLGPGRVLLDVGAGTGKLTRALEPTGARLIALEPVAEMRSVLRERVPAAEVLAGRAEEIPLGDRSVDAIVAGQAFHWFDGPRALTEFDRVLRPEAGLGLIWNRRDRHQPLQRAIDEIIAPYRGDAPAYHSDQWAQAFEGSSFAMADRADLTFAQTLDTEGFVDRVMSTSFIAALDSDEGRSVEERLRSLAEERLEPLRHTCQIFVYARA